MCHCENLGRSDDAIAKHRKLREWPQLKKKNITVQCIEGPFEPDCSKNKGRHSVFRSLQKLMRRGVAHFTAN